MTSSHRESRLTAGRSLRLTELTTDQHRALFAQAAPARQRLMAANKKLGAKIQNILTADQKTWLASHRAGVSAWPESHEAYDCAVVTG